MINSTKYDGVCKYAYPCILLAGDKSFLFYPLSNSWSITVILVRIHRFTRLGHLRYVWWWVSCEPLFYSYLNLSDRLLVNMYKCVGDGAGPPRSSSYSMSGVWHGLREDSSLSWTYQTEELFSKTFTRHSLCMSCFFFLFFSMTCLKLYGGIK